MPPLDKEFTRKVRRALGLARAGEVVRSASGPGTTAWKELYPSRLELLYEMAFLQIFVAWEVFLEETFYRYLCGYASRSGQAITVKRPYYRTIRDAENAVLGTRSFQLWHDPQTVVDRCKQFINKGPHEVVVNSNFSRLGRFSSVRHRIAHGQKHARVEFDKATMILASKRYRGSRPGSFLRDWDISCHPASRWLHSIGSELTNLASQIV